MSPSTMLNRDALRGKAQTVLGLVDPATLGSTLMHEHLIWDVRTPAIAAEPDQGPEITLCNCFRIKYGRWKVPRNLALRCRDTATREVADMVQAGGRTIVELTCGGLKPDPEGLVEIAQRTGAADTRHAQWERERIRSWTRSANVIQHQVL